MALYIVHFASVNEWVILYEAFVVSKGCCFRETRHRIRINTGWYWQLRS